MPNPDKNPRQPRINAANPLLFWHYNKKAPDKEEYMLTSRKTLTDIMRENDPAVLRAAIQDQIQKKQALRLFDSLPYNLSSVFSADAQALIAVIESINSKDIAMVDTNDNPHPAFTKNIDNAKLEVRSKTIIVNACNEFLTDTNNIKPDFLELIQQTPESLTSHQLLCAYFSLVQQYFSKALSEKLAAMTGKEETKKTETEQIYQTFNAYVNDYAGWVTEVLDDRLKTPNLAYEISPVILKEESERKKKEDENDHFYRDLAIGAGILGAFGIFGAGYLTYELYQNRNKNSASTDQPSLPQTRNN